MTMLVTTSEERSGLPDIAAASRRRSDLHDGEEARQVSRKNSHSGRAAPPRPARAHRPASCAPVPHSFLGKGR